MTGLWNGSASGPRGMAGPWRLKCARSSLMRFRSRMRARIWPRRLWPASVSLAELSLTCHHEVLRREQSSLPMIILDTNVVSELMRPEPDARVRQWVSGLRADELGTTAVTVAEIRHGIERLPDGRRREGLLSAATDLFAAFGELVQPFDALAAAWFGRVMVRRAGLGLPIEGFDAQIAAICRARGAVLATRNVKDFLETGVEVIDPWSA